MIGWSFYALGIPVPQGSKTGSVYTPKGGGRPRALIRDANGKTLKPWRDTVNAAAIGAGPMLEGPVCVYMVFTMPKPKSARKTDQVPFKKPDLDKLARSVCDAITAAGLWHDDAQVSEMTLRKVWTGHSSLCLPFPGVVVAAAPHPSMASAASDVWAQAGKAWMDSGKAWVNHAV